MTLGFAIASWEESAGPAVIVAADSRLTSEHATLSDQYVKTYEIGGRSAIIAAGNALPAINAADIVRPVIENHNRHNTEPMGFYDSVRLFAFFLRRASQGPRWSSQVAVVGFLQSGRPCIAYLVISPNRNRVRFFSVNAGQNKVIPVGNREASQFLLQGLATAHEENRPILQSGVSLLWYMSSHSGAFDSVGGGLTIGTCTIDNEHFSWPIIEIDGHNFLRGFDVTEYIRPSWPPAIQVHYDQDWCSTLDQQINSSSEPIHEHVTIAGAGYEIDELSTPESLFQTHDDPEEFQNGIARSD